MMSIRKEKSMQDDIFRNVSPLGFFDRKRKEGKIRHIGFSFHDTPEVLSDIIDDYEWEFCQLQINFLDWEIRKAKNLYSIATDKGLPIVVMEPLTGGDLQGYLMTAKQ